MIEAFYKKSTLSFDSNEENISADMEIVRLTILINWNGATQYPAKLM
jgi:hypothetical protein